MIRIILPLAVAVAAYFGPWFSEVSVGVTTGNKNITEYTGQYFFGNTADCFRSQNFSITGDCEPAGGLQGLLIFGAAAISIGAALLGVIGLLPFIGRLTSLFTVLAGGLGIGAFGYFTSQMMANGSGFSDILWGAYATAGLGFLTLLSGFSGMRGRD